MCCFSFRGKWRKIFLIMKLKIFFLLCCMGTLQAGVYSQVNQFSLQKDNVPVTEILEELATRSDYRFFYEKEIFKKTDRVSIQLKDASLKQVLDEVLSKQGFEYELIDKVVTIRRLQQQKLEKIQIRGLVTDSKKQPLPGVTVLIKGTALGAVTGANGQFLFAFPAMDNVVLSFSFVGMKTKELPYKGEKELNVVLEEEVAQMDEVVVTGIFNKAKESYTGAVKTITSKELRQVGNRNVLSSIRNLDPSFFIADNIDIGSDPNQLPDITMRGSGSMTVDVKDLQTDSKTLSSANQPLFIMDGFEITLERMMDLDDNQIETITLLKDASATAMYGTRGANGVVVITTKRPEPGRLQLTYRGGVNIEAPDFTSYNLLDAREKLEYEKLAGVYSGGGVEFDQKMKDLYNKRMLDVARGVNTYWLKYPVRTGVGHRHSLAFGGWG